MLKSTAWLLAACILSGLLLFYAPPSAYACSCAGPRAVEEELNKSDEVFAGRVLEVKEQRKWSGALTNTVHFEVAAVWKGGPQSQIIVNTGSGGGDCGFRFEQGKEYLVYAVHSDMYGSMELTTITCNRTKELVQAQEDLSELGEGLQPTEQVDLKGAAFQLYPVLRWLLLGILVVGIVYLMGWRTRRKWAEEE